jgi:hypothetical protein
MCKYTETVYCVAVYAALAALTGTLGWVLLHVGTTAPTTVL